MKNLRHESRSFPILKWRCRLMHVSNEQHSDGQCLFSSPVSRCKIVKLKYKQVALSYLARSFRSQVVQIAISASQPARAHTPHVHAVLWMLLDYERKVIACHAVAPTLPLPSALAGPHPRGPRGPSQISLSATLARCDLLRLLAASWREAGRQASSVKASFRARRAARWH